MQKVCVWACVCMFMCEFRDQTTCACNFHEMRYCSVGSDFLYFDRGRTKSCVYLMRTSQNRNESNQIYFSLCYKSNESILWAYALVRCIRLTWKQENQHFTLCVFFRSIWMHSMCSHAQVHNECCRKKEKFCNITLSTCIVSFVK